jgi:hypothetical protein
MSLLLHALLMAVAMPNPTYAANLPTVRAAITLHLNAPAIRAFPMFDPVNDARWSPDRKPTLLGDGKVTSGLIFMTGDDSRTTWLLDRYEPAAGVIRYVNFRTSMLTTIDITVVPNGTAASIATVTYTRTALDEDGVNGVLAFATHFPTQGPHWENAINAALGADRNPSEHS